MRIAWKKIGQDKEEKQETEEQENPKPEKEISGKMDLEREEKESPEEVRAIRSENKDPEKEDKVRREKPEVKRPVSGEAGKKMCIRDRFSFFYKGLYRAFMIRLGFTFR